MNVLTCDKCKKPIDGTYYIMEIKKIYCGLTYTQDPLDLCENCYEEIKNYIHLRKEK